MFRLIILAWRLSFSVEQDHAAVRVDDIFAAALEGAHGTSHAGASSPLTAVTHEQCAAGGLALITDLEQQCQEVNQKETVPPTRLDATLPVCIQAPMHRAVVAAPLPVELAYSPTAAKAMENEGGDAVVLCIGVFQLPGRSDHRNSIKEPSNSSSTWWPPEQSTQWCGSPRGVEFLNLAIRASGDYRAAVQLRRATGNALGAMHLVDVAVVPKGDRRIGNTGPGHQIESPTFRSSNTFLVPRAVDFMIAGFPKTGTSSLWFGLGNARRVSMYGTEPADWGEIERWRRQSTTTKAAIAPGVNKEAAAGFFEGGNRFKSNASGYGQWGKTSSLGFSPLLPAHGRDDDGEEHGEQQIVGFKCSKAVYEPRWILATLNLNPRARFIISLRRPADWLDSFFRYRRFEIQAGGVNAGWAAAMAAADPSLRTITFEDVARGHAGLLGAHRDNGHFVKWLRPIVDIAAAALPTPTAQLPQQQLLVLFLEELATDAAAVHHRAAEFVGLKTSELPFQKEPSSSATSLSAPVVNRGGASQAANRHVEGGLTRGDVKGGSGNEDTGEAGQKHLHLLLLLDNFYAESIRELDDLLLSALGVQNTWWPQRSEVLANCIA